MKLHASGFDGSRAGYTLIEMLIASVLVATLMTAVWGMMSMYNSYLVVGQNQSREQQLVRSLFQLIADDLQSVALPDSGRSVVPSFNPGGSELQSFSSTDGMSTGAAADPFRFGSSQMDNAVSDETAEISANGFSGTIGASGIENESGSMDGTEAISSPGVVAFSGTQQAFQLTVRRSIPDPFLVPPAGDSQQRGIIGSTANAAAAELPMQETLEGKAPQVTEFVTIIYQFQSPELMSSAAQGTPPGLYRIQTLSLPLQALLSQRSTLEQDLLPQGDAALDRTTLEAILFAQSEPGSEAVNQQPQSFQPQSLQPRSIQTPPVQTQLDRIPEVVACEFAYFDGNSWLSAWDSNLRNELPIAVRLRFRLVSSEDVQQLASLMSSAAAGAESFDLLTERMANSGVARNSETGSEGNIAENTAVDPLQNIRSKQVERMILLQPVKALITISGQNEFDAGDSL